MPYPMGMDDNWQDRVRALGFRQVEFAEAVDLTPANLSECLRGKRKGGVPRYLKALIIGLEMMTDEQRAVWLVRAKATRD